MSATFEAAWLGYKAACYGDRPLLEAQERETRQAFYSGAFAAFHVVSEISAITPEDESVAAMEHLHLDLTGAIKESIRSLFAKEN